MGRKLIVILLMVVFGWGYVLADDIHRAIKKLENQASRIEGIKELESLGDKTIPSLIQLTEDKGKDRNSRIAAIILLGKVKKKKVGQNGQMSLQMSSDDQKIKNTLETTLTSDQDGFCREAAALTLGNIGDKESIPKLKEALKDSVDNVRMRAALSLAKLGDTTGKEAALQALKDKDITAQLLAIDVLEEFNDQSIIAQLKQNLNSSDIWTRIHSMLAIKRIEVKALQGEQRLNYLREALKDKQFEINKWAAETLTREIDNNVGNKTQALTILKETAKNKEIAGCYSANKILRKLLDKGKISEHELQ